MTTPDRQARGTGAGRTPVASELAHLRPRDAVGLLSVGIAAGLTGLSVLLSARGGVALWGLGQVLLALALLQWFALLHECGHETLFRTKRLHGFVGHLASFFALIPFRSWKWVHGKHHRWTGWQDLDPTTVALVPRQLGRRERALVNVCWKYWIPIFSILYRVSNYWDLRRLRALFPHARTWRALAWSVALLLGAYAALGYLVGLAELARLAGLGLLLSLVVQDPLLLSQHTHIPQNLSRGRKVSPYPAPAQEVFTRSLRVPAWFARWVLLNLDAHELHHMYPFVPGYHLRRIGYATRHEIHWWRWVREAKRLSGEVFLFKNRTQSGFEI